MLAIGLGLFAFSMYLTATLTNQTAFWELFVPQVVRGLELICCYLPANMIALGTLPQDNMKNAAGLYNLTHDLGGAIGLAVAAAGGGAASARASGDAAAPSGAMELPHDSPRRRDLAGQRAASVGGQ